MRQTPLKSNYDAAGNLKMRRLRRHTLTTTKTSTLELETIHGITNLTNPSVSLHPESSNMVYPAGCTVVCYNWDKNLQGPFLISKNESCQLENISSPIATQTPVFSGNGGGVGGGILGNKNVNTTPKTVVSTAFSPDGKYLAVGETGHNPRVLVWDFEAEKYIAELKGHKFGVLGIKFTPDSKSLISLGYQHDGVLNIWNWRQGLKIASNRITAKVSSLAMALNGEFCVTSGLRHLKFWYFKNSNASGLTTQVLEGRSGILGNFKDSNFIDVTCTNDAALCYAITKDGFLCSFNKERKIDKFIDLKVKSALSLDYNHNTLICGCEDGIVRLFLSKDLSYLGTLPKPHPLGVNLSDYKDTVYRVEQNETNSFPDASIVKLNYNATKAVIVYCDRSYYIWDITNLKKISKFRSSLFHSDSIWGSEVINNKDKQQFLSCGSDGTVRIWNLNNNLSQQNIFSKELLKIIYIEEDLILKYQHPDIQPTERARSSNSHLKSNYEPNRGIRCLKLTSDGKYLVTGDRNGNLRVHDMKTYELITYQEAHDAEIMDLDVLTMLNDDNVFYYIASCSRDRLIHVFSMSHSSFKLVQTLDDHSACIASVKFFDQGNCLVSCGADKSIIFRGSKEKFNLPYYTQYSKYCGKATLYSMAPDHFSNTVTVVSQDKKILQFNVQTGKLINSYKPDNGEDISISRIALDASGLFACIGGPDKNVRLFDLNNGQFISSCLGHSEMITSVKFSYDCNKLISTSGDGCVYIWKVTPTLASQMRNKLAKLISPMSKKGELEYFSNNKNMIDEHNNKGGNVSKISKLRTHVRMRSNSVDVVSSTNEKEKDNKWSQKIELNGISVFNSNSKPKPIIAKESMECNTKLSSSLDFTYNHLAKFYEKSQDENNNKITINSDNDSIDEIINEFYFVEEAFDVQNNHIFHVTKDDHENGNNNHSHSPTSSDKDGQQEEEIEEITEMASPIDFHEDDINLEDDLEQPFNHVISMSLPTHRRSLSSRFLALNSNQMTQRFKKGVSDNNNNNNNIPNVCPFSNNTITPLPRYKNGMDNRMENNNKGYNLTTSTVLGKLRRSRSSIAIPEPPKLSIKLPEEAEKPLGINQLGIRQLIMSPTTPRPLSSNLHSLSITLDDIEEKINNEVKENKVIDQKKMDEISSTRERVKGMKDSIINKLKEQGLKSSSFNNEINKKEEVFLSSMCKEVTEVKDQESEKSEVEMRKSDEEPKLNIINLTNQLKEMCLLYRNEEGDEKKGMKKELIVLRDILLEVVPLKQKEELKFEQQRLELLEEYSKMLLKKVEDKMKLN
ncbi:WD40 repeat-like protein [Neoconidiobolus thromboides FSU 785]|nr:WD40 repeat-like protein [Neoconidiobolus thromboides FSU 785]